MKFVMIITFVMSSTVLFSQESGYNIPILQFYSRDTIVYATASDMQNDLDSNYSSSFFDKGFKWHKRREVVDTSTVVMVDEGILFLYRGGAFVKLDNIYFPCIFKSDSSKLYSEYLDIGIYMYGHGYRISREKMCESRHQLSAVSKYEIKKDTIRLLEINYKSGKFESEIEYTRTKAKTSAYNHSVIWFEESEEPIRIWRLREGLRNRKVVHLHHLIEDYLHIDIVVDELLGIPIKRTETWPGLKIVTCYSGD